MNKRVIVTGGAGFVGRHLVKELGDNGYEVWTTDAIPADSPSAADLPRYRQADLRQSDQLNALVRDVAPAAVIHLAAISFVPDAAKCPEMLHSINVDGAVNVAKSVLRFAPQARFLFVSSGQVYGPSAKVPVGENTPLSPATAYTQSKAEAEAALCQLREKSGLRLLIARPGNHTGPGQTPKFVVVSFARQILDAKNGGSKVIKVGNLESVRDFTDVRDVVRAYRLMLEKAPDGAIYNIASGRHLSIGEVLRKLSILAGVEVQTAIDPSLYRAQDDFHALDFSAITRDTGWVPAYTFERTLQDIISSLEK